MLGGPLRKETRVSDRYRIDHLNFYVHTVLSFQLDQSVDQKIAIRATHGPKEVHTKILVSGFLKFRHARFLTTATPIGHRY